MNKNVLIVLAGGFLIAVLVAVLVQAGLSGKKKEVAATSTNVEVLVAARDLRIGHELVAGDLKWQQWPQNSVFSGALVRKDDQAPSDAASGRLLQAISMGQPIHPNALVGAGKGNFLAATLKPGMRAVALSVNAESMAGGFVGPGDYVDVIVTYKVQADRGNPAAQALVMRQASETILENVRVLAADQAAKREEDKAKVARTVTVEVDMVSAEKLVLADEMGDIMLALRGIGDDTIVQSKEFTTDVKISKVLKGLAKAQNTEGGANGMVRVYNGQTATNIRVRQPVEE